MNASAPRTSCLLLLLVLLPCYGCSGLGRAEPVHSERLRTQSPPPPAAPGFIANLDAFIEDPEVFAQGQEPTHAPRTVPYATAEAARAANVFGTELEERWSESPYFQLLNGVWDFAYYDRPALVPEGEDQMEWAPIRVPKSWQTAGYDELVYRNIELTWTALDQATNTTPPDVPDDYNPVGVYRRMFTVDAAWEGRRTFLHFEGVKQAFFVWVNGTYVGYDQGTATPAEFDVTDLLDYGGENKVVVQVYRFSDAEALETMDALRFSGIHRSVYLFSKPSVHVRDFQVRTSLDDAYEDGTLAVDVDVVNASASGSDVTVEAQLFDADGQFVTTLSGTATVAAGAQETVSMEAEVERPALWSAEKPHLYELALTLTPAGSDAPTEAMVESVGFREYEVSDGLFRVNGVPVTIRGVNRPEHSPVHGRHVPFETLLHDVELMKRNEIDALRTAHYPNDPSVYVLADEYGLYVQDEINVETHWNLRLVNDQPAYHAQMVERFQQMVQRDRNRPSVFTWSTGNEAGYGPAHEQMAAYADSLPGTYILYHQDNQFDTAPYSPLHGRRYPSVDGLLALLDETDMPILMGEYRHAFGNTMGEFGTFWDLILPPTPDAPARLARLQGGFMWDWADQIVERPGQPPFYSWDGLDGIVAGDRTPYPELAAVKDGHEPFAVHPVDLAAGRVQIGNHYAFTNLAERVLTWALTADGDTLQRGTLDLDVPPKAWVEATVPFDTPPLVPGTDYWLTVELLLAEDTPYAEAGHVIGTERLRVPFDVPPAEPCDISTLPPVSVAPSDGGTTLSGERFTYVFDEAEGTFASLVYDGTEVLSRGPLLNLWRTPTLVDEAAFWAQHARQWREAGLDSLTHEVRSVVVAEQGDGSARVVAETTARGRGAALADVTYTYDVYGSGDVLLTVDVEPTDRLRETVPMLARVGIALGVPTSMDHVKWYGRGPVGSFPDRTGGTWPGVYARDVAELFEPVMPPQANGTMTETRWAALTGPSGPGLLLATDSLLAFGTNRFVNLDEADYVDELRPADALTVTLDHAFLGAGTKFHPPPEDTFVAPEPARFHIRLRPYDTAEERPAQLWKRPLAFSE